MYQPAQHQDSIKAKLLKDFPEIDESKYTTVSERKGYITIKLK